MEDGEFGNTLYFSEVREYEGFLLNRAVYDYG